MGSSFQKRLLDWFDAKKRDLPWRRTKDPYAIWVSEIMLQQTQVTTVIPYYERWMQRFVTVEELACADVQEVLSMWQGLGYYRRCRMLHQGAKFIESNGMPTSCEEWLKVPGVGRYTAGAISSIAFGEAAALVDGNVERVYARLSGDTLSGKDLNAAAWKWATRALDADRPGDWNQALMELGACICKPSNPDCGKCPLAMNCVANEEGTQLKLPVREEKIEVVHLDEIVWIPYHQGHFGLKQIPAGQWWHGMWEFPRAVSEADLVSQVGNGAIERAGSLTYHVTHHRIRMQAFVHRSEERSGFLTWVASEDLAALPLPAPQRKALRLAIARLESPALMPEEAAPR